MQNAEWWEKRKAGPEIQDAAVTRFQIVRLSDFQIGGDLSPRLGLFIFLF
jgi:hypothetical protein